MELQASEEKAHLRAYFLELRKLLPNKELLSRQATYQIISTGLFNSVEHILLYASTADEVNTTSLMKYCLYRSKHVYLPVVKNVSIAEMHSISGLKPNKYGILEPPAGRAVPAGNKQTKKIQKKGQRIIPQMETQGKLLKKIQLAVIPGVVFDFAGYRIGYGSGFYDLLMQKLPGAIRVGFAFGEQIIAAIPFEKHDQKVHYLVDERHTFNCLKRDTVKSLI